MVLTRSARRRLEGAQAAPLAVDDDSQAIDSSDEDEPLQEPFRLLDLPLDLQCIIYEDLLAPTQEGAKMYPQILATCKSVNAVAADVLSALNLVTLRFCHSDSFHICFSVNRFFVKDAPPLNPRSFKSLKLSWTRPIWPKFILRASKLSVTADPYSDEAITSNYLDSKVQAHWFGDESGFVFASLCKQLAKRKDLTHLAIGGNFVKAVDQHPEGRESMMAAVESLGPLTDLFIEGVTSTAQEDDQAGSTEAME